MDTSLLSLIWLFFSYFFINHRVLLDTLFILIPDLLLLLFFFLRRRGRRHLGEGQME
jgi:hypothetical protein